VLDGDPAPHKGAQPRNFWPMPVGREVGRGPGDIVLDGDPTDGKSGTAPPPPLLGPCLLWPKGWMDQDATWYGGSPRPRPRCVRWVPAPLPPEMGIAATLFSAHVYCDQTVANLSYSWALVWSAYMYLERSWLVYWFMPSFTCNLPFTAYFIARIKLCSGAVYAMVLSLCLSVRYKPIYTYTNIFYFPYVF